MDETANADKTYCACWEYIACAIFKYTENREFRAFKSIIIYYRKKIEFLKKIFQNICEV